MTLVFGAFLAGCPAHAADVVRSYTADITAVDAKNGTVTFVHTPSGYTMTAKATGATDMKRTRYFAPGEITEGQTIRIQGAEIDLKNHTITARECNEEPLAESDLVVHADQNQIAGKLFQETSGEVYRSKSGLAVGDWTTPNGQTSLGLKTADGQSWRLRWSLVTPLAHAVEPATLQDFQVGRRAGFTVADHGDGQGELQRATVEVWFAGAESRDAIGRCPISGPSGITAAQMQAQLEAVRQKFAAIKDDLSRKMPVSMEVKPQLVLVGEPVELTFRVLSAKTPNAKAVLSPDFLHAQMSPKEDLDLPWKQNGTSAGLPVYTATVHLPADKVGQYLVQWDCDAGGDIPQFSRSYAVCDNHSAVCLFLLCGGDMSGPKAEFHQEHLPFDFWTDILHLSQLARGGANDWANESRVCRQYGDIPDFGATAGVCTEPPEIARLGVNAVKELAPMLGYPESPISLWSYTIGNAGYRAMQATGDMAATSLCTENHIDGGMEINCWGKPERPYFMSAEDFRKPGPGGEGYLVGFSQLQRHTQLAQHYLCDYCPEAASLGGALLGATGHGTTFDELAFSRMLDGYDASLQMAQCQKTPYFVSESIQMNGARPGATEGNRLVLEYAIQKAKTGNVVFSNSCGVSQFYQRHYTSTPESTAYFHDWWSGTHIDDKADSFPDTMTMENGSLYALALAGQILPESTYDYTKKWDYPDFGNATLPRRLHDPNSYMVTGKYDKYAATPRLTDTRLFAANRTDRDESGSLLVTITVDAKKAQKNLPLALWNLPREFQPGDGWFHASGKSRFVPIVAPYTGNLNGFLIANVAAGHNVFTLHIDSPARPVQTLDFEIGTSLRGKIFTRDGQQMAYVWPSGPWPAKLHLHLAADKSAQAYVAPQGVLQPCAAGDTTVEIPQGQWMRLVGLDRDQIVQMATAEHQ